MSKAAQHQSIRREDFMKVAVASDKMNVFQPPTLPSLADNNDDGDFDDPEDSSNGGVSRSLHRMNKLHYHQLYYIGEVLVMKGVGRYWYIAVVVVVVVVVVVIVVEVVVIVVVVVVVVVVE